MVVVVVDDLGKLLPDVGDDIVKDAVILSSTSSSATAAIRLIVDDWDGALIVYDAVIWFVIAEELVDCGVSCSSSFADLSEGTLSFIVVAVVVVAVVVVVVVDSLC